MQNSLLTDALEFAQIIANENNQSKRVGLCVAKRKELTAHLNSAAGVRRYLTTYRAAINAHPQITKKIALLKSLKISRASNKKIQSTYEAKVILRTEKADYTIIKSSDIDAIIKKANDLLASGTRYKVAAGLLLLTGRRTAEIFLTGNFAPVKNDNKALKFAGQLKKRKTATLIDNKPYSIPVLTDSTQIIAANLWLKNQYNGLSTPKTSKTPTPIFTDIADVNKRVSKDLGATVKSEFAEFLGADVSPHDLRKAYAAISYFNNPKKQTISFRTFAKKILGHTDSQTGLTSEAYNKYKVI